MARLCPRLVLLVGLLSACSGRVVERHRTALGPFEIETRVVRISSGGFPNTSGNPFATMPVTYFALFHQGRPVTVATDGGRREQFWEARFLPGAPRPAVLLADTGVYLVSERDGALDTRVLLPPSDDMATLQWLDERQGQPGDEVSVGIADGSADPRTLEGGTLLLVGGQCVLDVPALETRCVRLNEWTALQAIGDFYAAGNPPAALSPKRTQLAFAGSRQAGTDYEYGLVVADYARGTVYAVPFDRDFTRFESIHDATPEWLAHYFEWTVEPDGSERLRSCPDVKPRPWLGRFRRFAGGMVDYDLVPARRELMPVFVSFVQRETGADLTPDADDPDTLRATVDGAILTVWFRPEERELSLFVTGGDTQRGYALVERLGAGFDQELARGRHQALFGSFGDDAVPAEIPRSER